MRVSETLNLNIPDDGLNVDRLERYLAKEIERFRKQVFGRVLQEIEAKKLCPKWAEILLMKKNLTQGKA